MTIMSSLQMTLSGYACVPYRHDASSVLLRNHWIKSSHIHSLFFATATFTQESKLYFEDFANHYIMACFGDMSIIQRDLARFEGGTSFVFALNRPLADTNTDDSSLISFYYEQYTDRYDGSGIEDVFESHSMVARASRGYLKTVSLRPPRFAFPYRDNIVALEATGHTGHLRLNQYCEKTKAELVRRGITLSRMMSVSVLETLK